MTNAANAGGQSNARGIAGVLFAGTVWGTTGTAATFAPDVSAAAIGAAAMGIGGLGQALLALRGIARARAALWQHRGLLVLGALAVMIYPLAFYSAMRLAGVTIGTVVTIGTAPLFAALIEYVMERSLLTLRWTVGALSGVAGMVLICLAEGSSHSAVGGSSVPLGVALGLLGGFTYALYSWTARSVMLRGVRSSVVMGATFGLGGMFLMPVLIVTGGPLLASWGNAAVGLYMAFVPMFLGYICFGYGLSRVRASTATTLTLIEPVVAAVLAVVIVGERLPALGWIGVGLVVVCLLVLTIPRGHRAQTVPPIPSE
ncbi:MAG: EamA family transporter [Sulfitobacter litoralis]|jgi:DME family drug/metabolite transporter|uniref:Drug/metabolite transporter, DME family n=1 Tax=Sulfitobacter litoralis TaxID=335975 RepID=A0ABY0SFQ4_9RHOB|nr:MULTISPECIES: EamA family transporter [Sulfitobacter]MBQ0717138.1 EamA family transporter [Sulfitobacter litoralis]MBQ0765561.1 EamA family transporter [Sulfitobacter litoralis]MBQ0801427.1 EamA family transporter [Sulfitobacter litoralis]MCF7726382.1 EamA family transporter [Sulfitobacter sp. M22]MCF7777725.1 EamA family transporter [Sulfitobacter sp. M220]|tara:strand:- start:951 stop:1895 length:945 start_codon:yes stop_codon:yes gene_type:complete